MASPPYIAPQQVLNYTGVEPRMLDMESSAVLNEEIETWILMAQEYAEEFLEVRWDPTYVPVPPEPVDSSIIAAPPPEGVKLGVLRIVGNIIAQAKIRRQLSIVSLNEFRQQLMPDTVFTESIKADLALWIGGGHFRQDTSPDQGARDRGFNLMVINGRTVKRLRERSA